MYANKVNIKAEDRIFSKLPFKSHIGNSFPNFLVALQFSREKPLNAHGGSDKKASNKKLSSYTILEMFPGLQNKFSFQNLMHTSKVMEHLQISLSCLLAP